MSSLAFSANGRTAWAGSRLGGVFRSADAGRTWTSADVGLRGEVRGLAAAAGAPARVYAATSEGVFRSEDAAAHWTSASAGLPPAGGPVRVRMVAAEPRSPDAVWAALDVPGELFRSTDRGVTWQRAAAGLSGAVYGLAFHPTKAGLVFAGTDAGLFRSQDSGRTWSRWGLRGQPVWRIVYDRDPSRLYALVLVPTDRAVFGTIRVSEDGGASWRAASPDFAGLGSFDLVADPLHAGTAWASASATHPSSVFRTTDGGRHWQGVEDREVAALAASPRRSGLVLGGEEERGFEADDRAGVVRSEDGGSTWAASGAGLASLILRTVVPDPTAAGALYAQGGCCAIWRRDGAGLPWMRLPVNAPSQGWYRLLVDPAHPATLYVLGTLGLSKSDDAGLTWRGLGAPFLAEVALDPAHPSVLYGADSLEPTLVKSTDGGLTWSPLAGSRGFYAPYVEVMGTAVYADGYVSTPSYRDRLRRSTDGGATWTTLLELGIPNAFVRSAVEDPRNPGRLWVGFTVVDASGVVPVGGGIFRSTDGGAHWELSRPGGGRPVLDLAIDPRDGDRLWAASDRGTVFQSTDGGATWAPYGEGLPPAAVLDLRVDPFDPDRLYAATEGGGVYTLTRTLP